MSNQLRSPIVKNIRTYVLQVQNGTEPLLLVTIFDLVTILDWSMEF